jgi:hypothetical protein
VIAFGEFLMTTSTTADSKDLEVRANLVKRVRRFGRRTLDAIDPRIMYWMVRSGWPVNANNRRLRRLRNCHRGRVGFLIGNGPSVQLEDLERLAGEITFCCNRFYLAYSKTSFRPNYTVSADDQMISDFGAEIVSQSGGQVFLVNNGWPQFPGSYITCQFRHDPSAFSTNVYNFIYMGGATIGAAIQLGYHMGMRKFLLYGVDHSFKMTVDPTAADHFRSAHGDENHFIPNYRSGKAWCPPATAMIEEMFTSSDRFLRRRGGWIKNATRGGHLEVVERTSFDQELALLDGNTL